MFIRKVYKYLPVLGYRSKADDLGLFRQFWSIPVYQSGLMWRELFAKRFTNLA